MTTTPPTPERRDQSRPDVTHYEAKLDAELVAPPNARARLLAYITQQEAAERERANQLIEGAAQLDMAATDYREVDMRMQRDVFCEKLNEYIDKTKEAEKRTETAESDVTRLRSLYETTMTSHEEAAKLAHSRGCELEAARQAANNTTCPNCGLQLEPRCQNCD